MIALLLALGLAGTAWGESSPGSLLRHWDNDQGLPASSVTAVVGTKDGYLWAGTPNGLTRFDGDRFLKPGNAVTKLLQGRHILSLAEDAEGALWVGTEDGGLFCLRGGQLESVPVNGQTVMVRSLVADKVFGILAAVADGGVMRWGANGWAEVGTNGLTSQNVTGLACDTNGTVWCLAGNQLLFEQAGRWLPATGVSQTNLQFQALTASRHGGVWAAAGLGASHSGAVILHVRPDGVADESSQLSLPGSIRSRVTGVAEDAAGTLWLVTYGAGVFYRVPNGEWKRFQEAGALAELIVNCVVADHEGSVWLGMASDGLYQIRRAPVTALRLPPSARENVVQCACGTRDGSIWIGTDGAGVFRYRDGAFTQFGVEQGLADLFVGVLHEDRAGNLWAGTGSGLFRFEDGRFQPVARGVAAVSLLEDHEGRLWMGFQGGVARVVKDEVKWFRQPEGMPSADVIALEEDISGRIWAAVPNHGLYYLTNETFERFAPGQWPEERNVRSLHGDRADGLWIASYGKGLLRLKDGQLRRWSTSDGLPDNGIHAVIGDGGGNLWMASDSGIFSCSMEELEQYQPERSPPLLCRRVTVEDGLASKVCTGYGQPVVGRATNGWFWFPNRQTLAGFNPRELRTREDSRVPVVIEVLADGEPQLITGGKLRFSARVRRFEFHFTSPDLVDGSRLRFGYFLEGADQEWVNAEKQRVAYYHHLPPGNYQFRLRVGGPDGRWVEGGPGLAFELLPQWWQRKSVQAAGMILAAGIVAGAGWGVARARARRKLRQFELREGIERERRRIAQDLHDELGAGLTELMLLADAAGRSAHSPTEVGSRTARIAARAQVLSATTDEIVWTLNPRNDSLRNLVGYLSDFGQSFLRSSPVRCRLDIPDQLPDRPVSAGVRHNLLLAFKEALNNVVKHAQASEVWVRVQLPDGRLRVTVEDNGHGLGSQVQALAGDGLTNMRERMAAMGGQAEIGATPAGGTMVTFELPLAG